jgi:hypothetical protein
LFVDFLIPVSSLAALTLLYDSTGSAGVASTARLGMWVKRGFMKDKWVFCGMFAHYCILVFDEFLKHEKYWDLMDDEEVDEERQLRALVFFVLADWQLVERDVKTLSRTKRGGEVR